MASRSRLKTTPGRGRPRLSIVVRAVSVERGGSWALRDVSVELRKGQRWALVGGNGAGKTQLLKLLATLVWPTPTGRESRHYRLGRREVDLVDAKRRIAYVGAELQDKYARYDWNHPIGDLLATGLHDTDLLLRPVSAWERRRVQRMLVVCGLEDLERRPFLSLSYGQKRLALLARALIRDPDWLFLDEFYNGLDREHRDRIDALLAAARTAGTSWVAAAHRAVDVPRGTNRLLELVAGRVRSSQRLSRTDLARLAAAAREAAVPIQGVTMAVAPAAPLARGKTLLRVRDADLYVDYRKVLERLNWTLRAGEHWAVFGANGAGKSTFLKLLYGDLSPALGGTIERHGFAAGTPIAVWKRRTGYVSPELQTDYSIDVTVRDLVASGRHASIGLVEPPTPADLRHAERWLRFFSLAACAVRRPRELSYGQLRRALFARALAADPRLLLLDEPLTGLDPRQRSMMKSLLEQLMARKLSLIIAVHHPEDLPRGMTHALWLNGGQARTTVGVTQVAACADC